MLANEIPLVSKAAPNLGNRVPQSRAIQRVNGLIICQYTAINSFFAIKESSYMLQYLIWLHINCHF